MRTRRRFRVMVLGLAALAVVLGGAVPCEAGPIFLTGHDPDFHAQGSAGAQNLLKAGLAFVTNNTYNDGTDKFLWVESRISPPAGHLVGENGLSAIGLTRGVNYDRANAAELATVNFSNYTAIVVASSFGGLLTRAELNALIARKSDIAAFVNAGHGVMALSESTLGADLLGSNPPVFGFLPVTVSTITDSPPFTVTAAGAAAPFFLKNSDVNDPTHNSFGLIAGLTPLDRDSGQNVTTLAGDVTIGGGGFGPPGPAAPEPSSLALLALGGLGLAGWRRWRKRTA